MSLWCAVITLFPEMFSALTGYGVTRRAVEQGFLSVHCWNPRDFTVDKHSTIDDRPYGGGPGMVMTVTPLRGAIQAAKKAANSPVKVVYLSPQGQVLDQAKLRQAALGGEKFIFIAGRYEGIDERVIDLEVDEEWSIGEYVLSGGELPVMIVIDSMVRWVKGVLGHEESAQTDSFADGLLGCPQYTRPEVVEGLSVPEVLLSGNHALIDEWRLQQRIGRTWARKPELLEKRGLNLKEQRLLKEFIQDYEERMVK